jgi:hypothetical protein
LQEKQRERNQKQPLNSHQGDVPACFHDFERVQAAKRELRIHEHLCIPQSARKYSDEAAENKERNETPKRVKAPHPQTSERRAKPGLK